MIVQQNQSEGQPDMREIRESYRGLFNTQLVSEWINRGKSLSEFPEYRHIHPNLVENWKTILLKEAKPLVEDK